MESLDEERLIIILETAVSIVLGQKTSSDLTSTLLDIDEHVRTSLVTNLVVVFRRGLAMNLDLEAFDAEIEKLFSGAKLLSKALHHFWRKQSEVLQQQYTHLCPLDNRFVDLKWVAALPSDAKFGVHRGGPFVELHFTTTDGGFAIDFTPNGIDNLVNELAAIQTALGDLK
jgi:hypothetical protein